MLIRLGKPAPAGGDAVALLLECHERIRAFLALARHIGEARSSQAQPIAEAADQVVRYFTEALPLHARDEEEESVLPRLRGKEPMVDAELEEMAREHAGHDGPLRTVVAACAELAHDPTRHEPRQRAAESEKIDRPLGRSRQPVIRLSCAAVRTIWSASALLLRNASCTSVLPAIRRTSRTISRASRRTRRGVSSWVAWKKSAATATPTTIAIARVGVARRRRAG